MEYKVERDGTLLPFLLERMEGRSRSSVKSYLTHGQVAVNGCHTTRHDTPLTAGDTVTVTKTPDSRNTASPDAPHRVRRRTADSCRQTERIAFGRYRKRAPQNRLLHPERIYQKEQSRGPALCGAPPRPGNFRSDDLCQRQADTGNPAKNWKTMVLDRRYAAVVEGRLPQTKGTIATLLREDRNRKVWASCNGTGEEAATDYTVLREGRNYSLVELSLHTGKKNQIRAHMEWMKTPIAGDEKIRRTDQPGRTRLPARLQTLFHPPDNRRAARFFHRDSPYLRRYGRLTCFPVRKREPDDKTSNDAYALPVRIFFTRVPSAAYPAGIRPAARKTDPN